MANINTRITLFNSYCLAARIGIILLLYFFPYPEMSILPFIIAFGFLYKKIKRDNRGVFGGVVFWPRLLHSMNYLIAAILLLFEDTRKYAFWVLVGDIIIGFFIFWYHYRNFIFSKQIK